MEKKRKILNRFNYWDDWRLIDLKMLANCYALNEIKGLDMLNELANKTISQNLNSANKLKELPDLQTLSDIYPSLLKIPEDKKLEVVTKIMDQINKDLDNGIMPKLPNLKNKFIVDFTVEKDDEDTDELVKNMLEEIGKNMKSELTPIVITIDRNVLKEPLIGQVLCFLSKSAEVDKDDEKLLNKILKAIKGDKRGSIKIDKLKNVITNDIKDFASMAEERVKGKTVHEITDNYDTTKLKVWSNYIKKSRLIMKEFNLSEKNSDDWILVLNIFLQMCKRLEKKPLHQVFQDPDDNSKGYVLYYGFGK